jgi:Na+/H+ antiporter NhaD/arsenite permease-like protein
MSRLTHERVVKRSAFHPSAAARNTILILSGYLLGTTAAHVCSPTLERGALAAGLIGTLTYALLSFFSRQKHVNHARRAVERATVLMLKWHAAQSWSHEQYLPVASAPQRRRSFNSMR